MRGVLAGSPAVCYKRCMRDVREWMRDQMRRRSRRGPNDSESTGKIGQELPTNQPAPLRPNYPDYPPPAAKSEPAEPATREHHEPVYAEPEGSFTSEPVPEREAEPAAAARSQEEVFAEPEGSFVAGQESGAAAGFSPATPDRKVVVETQPENPSASPEQAAKSPKGYVVLTIGLPGSGKTTWYKRRGVTPLSSDMLRTILFDDITEQRYQGLVFSTLRSLLRARLIAKMPWNYVDATNLSAHERRQWIKMAKSFGYEVQAVFFDVPLAVCLERNAQRDRQVTDEVMHKMAERLRPPSFKEGFDKITVVRVKGQPAGAEIAPAPAVPAAEATGSDLPSTEPEAAV